MFSCFWECCKLWVSIPTVSDGNRGSPLGNAYAYPNGVALQLA